MVVASLACGDEPSSPGSRNSQGAATSCASSHVRLKGSRPFSASPHVLVAFNETLFSFICVPHDAQGNTHGFRSQHLRPSLGLFLVQSHPRLLLPGLPGRLSLQRIVHGWLRTRWSRD